MATLLVLGACPVEKKIKGKTSQATRESSAGNESFFLFFLFLKIK